jgi:NADPH:quinone reductase-like Zn-dependent oxidoreductase
MRMKAIVQTGFGPAVDVLQLQEVPRPAVEPDRVLVRMEAAGIATGNWLVTRGLPWIARPMYGLRTPRERVSGLEFAGVVEEVGGAATGWEVGDEVFGMHGGAYAEWIVVPPDAIARKPVSVSMEHAAAAPISGVAALQAVRDAGRVEAGQRMLVVGASGGVGSFVLQIARAYGAHVTGVASTRSLERLRRLGAHEVIDYTQQRIDAHGGDYDVVIDIAGNRSIGELRGVLKPRGTLVIVGGTGGRLTMGFGRTVRAMLLDRLVGQRLVGLLSTANAADLAALAELMEDGRVRPEIEPPLPLAQAPEAIDRLGNGHRGGTLVLRP